MKAVKPDQVLSKVPEHLKIATTQEEFRKIWELRNDEYSKLYPEVAAANDDAYDGDACVLYSENSKGETISTGRLAFDGVSGLPADKILKSELDQLREKGLKLAESSKLAINKEAFGILPFYFFTYYEICIRDNIDSVIFITWNKRIPSYKKYVDAKVLVEDIGYSYGTEHTFSLLECRIKEAAPTIIKHMEKAMKNTSSLYPVKEWDNYARIFASVTPSIQLDIYREACTYLHGNVVDCGSGAAKIAPFLADEKAVTSYTGVDYSKEMIRVAQWVLDRIDQSEFNVCHNRIEEVTDTSFSSAVSIQSYYSWPDPLKTLKHIFNMLSSGGVFVLATPNKNLNVDVLLKSLKQELIAHPDFEAYIDYNLKLASNPQANFVGMDELIGQAQQVGFQVQECHQRHLQGGMNFLVLRKES